jgi:hypothetical protein
MALASAKGTVHPPVEGLDRGVQDSPGRIEMPGTEGIRIARKPGPWEEKPIRGDRRSQFGGDLVRLKGFEFAVWTIGDVIRASAGRRPRI